MRSSQSRFGAARLGGIEKRKIAYEGHVVRLRDKNTAKARDSATAAATAASDDAIRTMMSATPATTSGYSIVRTNPDGSVMRVQRCDGQFGVVDQTLLAELCSLRTRVMDESADADTRLRALAELRRNTEKPRDFPLEELVRSGTVVLFETIIRPNIGQEFIRNAAHGLLNIIAECKTSVISDTLVSNGILENLAGIFALPDLKETVAYYCIWLMANIIMDSGKFNHRDSILRLGLATPMFMWASNRNIKRSTLGVCVLMCRAMVCTRPMPPDDVCKAVATVCVLAMMEATEQYPGDTTVLRDCLNTIEVVAEKAGSRTADDGTMMLGLAEQILATPLVPGRLLSLFNSPDSVVSQRAIRTVANFASNTSVKPFVDAGLITILFDKINETAARPNNHDTMRKLVWIVESMAAESSELVAAVMKSGLYALAIRAACAACTNECVTAIDGSILTTFRMNKSQPLSNEVLLSACYMLRNIVVQNALPDMDTSEHVRLCWEAGAVYVIDAGAAMSESTGDDGLCLVVMETLQYAMLADKQLIVDVGDSFGVFASVERMPSLKEFIEQCNDRVGNDPSTIATLRAVEELMDHPLPSNVQINAFNGSMYPDQDAPLLALDRQQTPSTFFTATAPATENPWAQFASHFQPYQYQTAPTPSASATTSSLLVPYSATSAAAAASTATSSLLSSSALGSYSTTVPTHIPQFAHTNDSSVYDDD